jgi:protein involved in polysaccharide export with SLBB domain
MVVTRRKSKFRLPILAFLVFALAGPVAGARGQSPTGALATRAAMMRAMPGDKVALLVYGDPTLSGMATLDEKGRIMLPRIGMIQADEMPIAALRDTIRARMSAILRDPAIEVTVLRRIVVAGEVTKPGVYYADLTSSLGEMVAQSGGLKETANPSKVYLLRGPQRIHVGKWESDQSPATDLHSGDQILVGRKSWLALNIIPFAGVSTAIVSLVITVRQSLRN